MQFFLKSWKFYWNNINFTKEVIILGVPNVNWEFNKVRKNLKKVMDGMDKTHVINGPTWITDSTITQIDFW